MVADVALLSRRICFGFALASAASGFGERCGYTVTEVDETSIKLVHETSVQHYMDTVVIALEDEVSFWPSFSYPRVCTTTVSTTYPGFSVERVGHG